MTIEKKPTPKEAYDFFAGSTHNGVAGIVCVRGAQPGPVVGITFCTHGNEPCGMQAAYAFLTELDTSTVHGSIYFVLNNLRATERYVSASTDKQKSEARYVDMNMNRLPDNLSADSGSYEVARARELLPIWQQFRYGLDIHSTTLPSVPFIVNLEPKLSLDLIAGLPITKILSNVKLIQNGYPATHFYGTEEMPARTLGVECGTHEDDTAFSCALESIKQFLVNSTMLQDSAVIRNNTHAYEEYVMHDAVFFPDMSYRLTKLFPNFAPIKIGDVLASGDGENIVAQRDGCTLFASGLAVRDISEEALFISLPPVKISV